MWPLDRIRLVELSGGFASALCAKILADAGASVTVIQATDSTLDVEPADSWRAFLSRGKSRVEVDSGALRATCDSLVADAHVYLTPLTHERAVKLGLDCATVRKRHPYITTACITPFGQHGPYRALHSDDAILCALSGIADATPGFPDRCEREDAPPVQSRAPLAEVAGGVVGAVAILGSLSEDLSGRTGSRHVEVAVIEAAVSMMIWEWATTAYGGIVRGRRPGHADLEPNCYLRCKDGNAVIVAFYEKHWSALVEMMGEPSWASKPEFADAETRAQNWEELHAHLSEWLATLTAADVLSKAQERGLPFAPAMDLLDVLRSDHVAQMGSVEFEGGHRFPPDPITVNGQRRRRAPRERRAAAGRERFSLHESDTAVHRPLVGVRVLDLTHFAAGPYAGELLAALGAEVIIIESRAHLISRGFGPYSGRPGPNTSMLFNHVNRGKLSVELNLSTARGREILARLVRSSDVVLENFSRRAAERLGLTYGELAENRSDIVVASISGFGRRGPWGSYVGLHSAVILLSGLASVTRDERGRPRLVASIYPDLLAGAYTACGVIQALAHRSRTGCGSHIEVSMLDVTLTSMGGLVNDSRRAEVTRRHPVKFLRTGEVNRFLAVSDRSASHQETAGVPYQTRVDAMASLQERSMRAGSVLDMSEVQGNDHLIEIGFIEKDDHPVAGSTPVPAVPWRYDGLRPRLHHAPLLGESTHAVLGALGGLSRQEISNLRHEHVIW